MIGRSYGRKLGLIRHIGYLGLGRVGWFRRWEHFNQRNVHRLVFVCDGNICRSAYAELRAATQGLNASSYGLLAQDGTVPPHAAIQAANARGVDLAVHRARSITQWVAREGDLVVAMEPKQARALEQRAAQAGAQLTLAGLWSTPYRPYIQDPYSLALEYFETCYSIIDDSVAAIAHRIAGARSTSGRQ